MRAMRLGLLLVIAAVLLLATVAAMRPPSPAVVVPSPAGAAIYRVPPGKLLIVQCIYIHDLRGPWRGSRLTFGYNAAHNDVIDMAYPQTPLPQPGPGQFMQMCPGAFASVGRPGATLYVASDVAETAGARFEVVGVLVDAK